eukprot:1111727-Pleurochrysis_carterae.AAC.2
MSSPMACADECTTDVIEASSAETLMRVIITMMMMVMVPVRACVRACVPCAKRWGKAATVSASNSARRIWSR